jgi:hypothetical protein
VSSVEQLGSGLPQRPVTCFRLEADLDLPAASSTSHVYAPRMTAKVLTRRIDGDKGLGTLCQHSSHGHAAPDVQGGP